MAWIIILAYHEDKARFVFRTLGVIRVFRGVGDGRCRACKVLVLPQDQATVG